MASGEPNLKVNVGADTSQFTKGMRQARADLKSFGSVSDDVLGKLGSLIGIDTKQVDQLASAIRGMGQKLQGAGQEGDTAFGKIATAAKGAGASIAAIGLAAAVATFKLLNAEAEVFKNTVVGANIELQTKAYIDTYRQAFHDFNAGAAQNVAEWEASWQKAFARFKANFAQNITNSVSGNTSWATAFGGPLVGALFGNREQIQAADAAATRAEQIAGRLYELDRLRSDQTRKIADLDAQIAEQRAIMRDNTYTDAERLAAYRVILEKINEKEALQLPIERERTALMDELVSLTNSTPAQVDAANQQYVRQESLVRQIVDEKTALLRYANSLQNAEAKTAEDMAAQLELAKQLKASREELANLSLGVSAVPATGAVTNLGGGILPQNISTTALSKDLKTWLGDSLVLEVGFTIDKGKLSDFGREVESVLGGVAVSISESIGGLVGDLLTGGDAFGNFKNAALSAFGEMATAVGKIAIQTGIAALGIKASLESLGAAGPAIAIAAGAALVALGSAVKAGLSNVASGSYSATQNVASSTWSAGRTDFETRDINFHVTGELVADGDKLVAVINNTGKRNDYTT